VLPHTLPFSHKGQQEGLRVISSKTDSPTDVSPTQRKTDFWLTSLIVVGFNQKPFLSLKDLVMQIYFAMLHFHIIKQFKPKCFDENWLKSTDKFTF
jgi:hypothetical protein